MCLEDGRSGRRLKLYLACASVRRQAASKVAGRPKSQPSQLVYLIRPGTESWMPTWLALLFVAHGLLARWSMAHPDLAHPRGVWGFETCNFPHFRGSFSQRSFHSFEKFIFAHHSVHQNEAKYANDLLPSLIKLAICFHCYKVRS